MFKFIEAVLILSGTIIGAGMFAIPLSFARAGFILGTIELVILAGVVAAIHLLYGEVVAQTPSSHRLPGYVRLYLGRTGAALAWGSAVFGIIGALLAYIIVGSLFLDALLGSIAPEAWQFFWATAIVAAGAAITLFPLKKEAAINGVLTVLLIGFILFLIAFLLPRVEPSNLSGFEVSEALTPYGVLLFALSGGTVIPDLVAVLGRNRPKIRLAVMLGSLVPAVLYFLFALAVVGALGTRASEETVRGLGTLDGQSLVIVGSVVGFLAVFTSFIVLQSSFQAMLRLDFGLRPRWAWLSGAAAPFFLYVLGLRDFLAIVGAVGAIAIGIDTALILAMYSRLRKRHSGPARTRRSYAFGIGIYAMVTIGIVAYLYQLLW
jgi:tyrosine-specific transport protein